MQPWDVEMQRRTTAFANAILDVVDRLPSTRSSNIIANQMGRSATSVMANHAESARPKSIADKIAKQGPCLQELQETRAWLVLLQQRTKLRRKGLMGTAVKLKIRWPDFTTPTRQLTLTQPTDEAEVITDAVLRLFNQIWPERQPVRLIGVGVSGLGTPPRQLSLWDVPTPEEQARQAKLRAALDALHARFGAGVVRRGSELGTEE